MLEGALIYAVFGAFCGVLCFAPETIAERHGLRRPPCLACFALWTIAWPLCIARVAYKRFIST